MEKKEVKQLSIKEMLELTIGNCKQLLDDSHFNLIRIDDYGDVKQAYNLLLLLRNRISRQIDETLSNK